jgi:hypothetical protein
VEQAVFERFSILARRSVFSAHWQARDLGSPQIMTVHLLLGILREDESVAAQVGTGAFNTIRKELELHAPPKEERVSASVDLPLSKQSMSALTYAMKEAEALDHKLIDAPHLVLGLLRVQKCTAARLLRAYGIDSDRFRAELRAKILEGPAPLPAQPSLGPSIQALENLLDAATANLHACSDSLAQERLKRNSWTRKEALGHLIDWAMAHQQWLVQALLQPAVTGEAYPAEAAVAAQHYGEFSWKETLDLWVLLNRLLVHVLQRLPEDRLQAPCRIGIAAPVSLEKLVRVYVEHCEDIAGQVLAGL